MIRNWLFLIKSGGYVEDECGFWFMYFCVFWKFDVEVSVYGFGEG